MDREDGSDHDAEKHEEDWWEKLRIAETETDFDALKESVEPTIYAKIFLTINSPEVLRACLRHMNLEKEPLLEFARDVMKRYRVDLLEVFLEHLTWEEFTSDDVSFGNNVGLVVEGGNIDVMVFLLDRGMSVDYDVQSPRRYRIPILCLACLYGKVDVIDLLLQRGADTNKGDDRGRTPAFYAMFPSSIFSVNTVKSS